MYQSTYLFKLLSVATLCICINTACFGVTGPEVKRQQLRKIYLSQIGVKEKTGANDGFEVERYLRYSNLKAGSSWCAAFVCWCLGKAGLSNPRSGWSPDLFVKDRVVWQRNRGYTHGQRKKVVPAPGDVYGLYFPDKGRIAHCGFVDSWSDNWVIGVEGNTNEAGSREGEGVFRKRRLIQQVYVVARYW